MHASRPMDGVKQRSFVPRDECMCMQTRLLRLGAVAEYCGCSVRLGAAAVLRLGRSSWQWLHVIWCHIECNPDNKSSRSTLVAWLCTFWGTSQWHLGTYRARRLRQDTVCSAVFPILSERECIRANPRRVCRPCRGSKCHFRGQRSISLLLYQRRCPG